MKLWRADRTNIKLVDCPDGRYPGKDADGKVIYDNSHFDSPADAWAHVLTDLEAGVEFSPMAVKEHRRRLDQALRYMEECLVEKREAEKNFEQWKQSEPASNAKSAWQLFRKECLK